MVWEQKDDEELQECLDRLVAEQKKHQSVLTPLGIIINNVKSIQIRTSPSHTSNDVKSIKILPKDKWGENMKDKVRLQYKQECIDKTIELLGKSN